MPTHRIRTRPPRGQADLNRCTSTEPNLLRSFTQDAAHYPGGHARVLARPRSEADVATLLTRGDRVLAVGDQSSLTGGATPNGGTVLSTVALDRVLRIERTEITVEAGLSLRTLQEQLDAHGAFYPPVPTYDGATAGGVVATNAAGAATFKYGSTRAWVRGLTVVLADGNVLDLKRGEVCAHPDGYFEIESAGVVYRVPVPRYQMPKVPKCSAGYFAEPHMDLVDLFVGSEGTLGVVTSVVFGVLPQRPLRCLLWLPVPEERRGLDLATTLRETARATWHAGDPLGIDVAAIEHLDQRSLQIIREDGADRAHDVSIPSDAHGALITQLELPASPTFSPQAALEQIATACDDLTSDPTSGPPLVRMCRILQDANLLDTAEVALPTDQRRQSQLLAVREAVPAGVNRRVASLQQMYPGVRKTAADMIAPFDRFGDSLTLFQSAFERRGLDYAIWGHISDGNLHPNVIPRSVEDVEDGHEAILECGRAIIQMGGCPMAEHGVGRNMVKQTLLRELYGADGIEEMRRIKSALDARWRLAPGVLFPVRASSG